MKKRGEMFSYLKKEEAASYIKKEKTRKQVRNNPHQFIEDENRYPVNFPLLMFRESQKRGPTTD